MVPRFYEIRKHATTDDAEQLEEEEEREDEDEIEVVQNYTYSTATQLMIT